MSKLNLTDGDFSGLKSLHEKLSSTNIQRCLFIGSEMSGLFLNSNNVFNCDFTNSDMSNSQIQNSIFNKNEFRNCSLKGIKFSKSYIENCDFIEADFTDAEFKNGGFGKNTIEKAKLNGTILFEMAVQDIIFEGTMENSRFENCSFYGVKFQNATLLNIFFTKVSHVGIACRFKEFEFEFIEI